jgi:hypothetical protein
MTDAAVAWAILIVGWIIPMLHVVVSPRSGGFAPPPGSSCPIGPRLGWMIMVLLLGPVGWALFWRARVRR